MTVDPQVSRRKFKREIDNYRQIEDHYLTRGIWLLTARFPEAFFVLATPHAAPKMVLYGVLIDFTDYDERPLSVRFVDPFTRKILAINEVTGFLFANLGNLLFHFPRSSEVMNPEGGIQVQIGSLLQAFENGVPFLCLPGVREYHENPAHSGDSWFLHRRTGEGTLAFILENLYKYGVEKVQGPNFHIAIAGIRSAELPPK